MDTSTNSVLLSTGQAAKILSVSRHTMQRYIRDNNLPHIKLPGGHIRIRSDVLQAFIDQMQRR
jgi:excisionase family DNA binding protein